MSTNPIYATGLDAGSTFTRCVIATAEDERFRFLGYGCVPSDGWAKGRIADQNAVSACIHAAVVQAEEMAHATIETVVAGVGGLSVRGDNTRGKWDLGRPREITDKDIRRAMENSRNVKMPEDRMLLQVLPQDFVVDDHPGFHDPRQMLGSVLEANAHLVTVSAAEHAHLVGTINKAHLAVDETIYEAMAACYATVLEDDRRDGVAVIDIGQHSTELVCFYGESGQLAATLKICGDHFSRDLAHALRIPIEAASVVKEQFGSAIAHGTPENSVVEVPYLEGREARDVPRRFINEILESRTVELFEMVRGELARYGMQNALSNGVVICGAGALLSGICDVAERVLQCPARIGIAQGILDWPEELKDPAWTTAAGLAMYSARLRCHSHVDKQSDGAIARYLK